MTPSFCTTLTSGSHTKTPALCLPPPPVSALHCWGFAACSLLAAQIPKRDNTTQHNTPTAPDFRSPELPLSISYFSLLSLGGFALVCPCSLCWGNTLCATRLQAANSLSPGPCGQLGSPPPASASPAGETPPLQPASPKQQDVANRLLRERVMRAGAWRRWCSGRAAPAPRYRRALPQCPLRSSRSLQRHPRVGRGGEPGDHAAVSSASVGSGSRGIQIRVFCSPPPPRANAD